jgi:hypothetical protein
LAMTDTSSKRVALFSVVVHRSGFIVGGDAGTMIVFDKEASNFIGDGQRVDMLGCAVCVLDVMVVWDDLCAGAGPRRPKKPEFLQAKLLVVCMLGSPVAVRSLCLSPAQDSVGLCVDGGVGTASIAAISLMSEDDHEAQVRCGVPCGMILSFGFMLVCVCVDSLYCGRYAHRTCVINASLRFEAVAGDVLQG